jgi:PmbA protein
LSGLVTVAVVSNGQEMANDYQIKLAKLSTIDTDELTSKAAATALQKLGGDVAPTGQYPVVFDPEAMSDLLQTYSSVFSSEMAQKGLSKLAGQEGAAIASEMVTLVDDPFYPTNPGSRNFDAEGSPTHCKKVIENGVFNTLLYNLKTAAVAGKKTTGNASKAGYAGAVGISPFTMYLAPGEISEEALLAKAGEGVYINSLGGLHAGADPISGDFSLQSSGFMIRDGKKAEYVKSFTVAGNFYEMLKNIRALADNCTLPRAMGMTTFGSPSVLVDGLSVAGK